MSGTWTWNDPTYESDEINEGLAVSPWAGHRDFAYDLLVWRRPRLVVELGTHYGCSLFAFAQAVKDRELSTHVVAVDTWQGEEHAGRYGDEVLDTVERTVHQSYPRVPLTLRRSTFLDALDLTEDASIDVLHIDGFHSYEAVREDFETWYPKLAPDAIVLFHDVASDNEYESPRFWQEVSAQHPSFEFPHSYGLGVLFPNGDHWYRALQAEGVLPWLPAYRWRAEARLSRRQLADTRTQLEERWEVVQHLEQMVRDRDETLAAQAALLEERWKVMQHLEEMVRDRDEALVAQATLLEDRWEIMQDMELAIARRDEQVRSAGQPLMQEDVAPSEKQWPTRDLRVVVRRGAEMARRKILRRQ